MVLEDTNSLLDVYSAVLQAAAGEKYKEKCFFLHSESCMSPYGECLGVTTEHTCDDKTFSQGHIKYGCLHHVDWPNSDHGAM